MKKVGVWLAVSTILIAVLVLSMFAVAAEDGPCTCKDGVAELTVQYNGPNGKTITAYDDKNPKPDKIIKVFNNVQTGDLLTITSASIGQSDFNNDISFWYDEIGQTIHVSCSKPLFEQTFGAYTVKSYTDKKGNVCSPAEQPECGNGILETGEECDDGNLLNGDGCNSNCELEEPPGPICGNGILETGEECDDGNLNVDDGCDDFCMIESTRTECCLDGSKPQFLEVQFNHPSLSGATNVKVELSADKNFKKTGDMETLGIIPVDANVPVDKRKNNLIITGFSGTTLTLRVESPQKLNTNTAFRITIDGQVVTGVIHTSCSKTLFIGQEFGTYFTVTQVGGPTINPQCVSECEFDFECDDNNVCNGVEVCISGSCQPGQPLNCDDFNACTIDTCDPLTGCGSILGNDPDGDGIPSGPIGTCCT